jgi:cell division septum initiation protein DivIVA
VAFRGYDRAAVDAYVAKVAQLVAELEATQLRESVVQRALEEVGEQTSGILQHAHETAEEVTSTARSQAEGHIQRAKREAETIRADAQRYVQEMQAQTASLREERLRLIDEIRQFADEVLGVADDALDRLPEPGASDGATEGPAGDAPAEPEN